jgi:hypothetical protein
VISFVGQSNWYVTAAVRSVCLEAEDNAQTT